MRAKQDVDQVRDYYTEPRRVGAAEETIYDIWERGGAFHDSITPSTYVPEYRSHMVLKLLSLTQDGASIFSLGCGNGFVEGDLCGFDREVRAIDLNDEAVELTRRKGVDAFAADFYALLPSSLGAPDVVYADGFLGHLFDPELGTGPALAKLKTFDLKSGGHLVISNDAPRDATAPYAPHDRLSDFWFLSKNYLGACLAEHGFEPVESYYFPYLRPISGMRNRTICVARVP
ncbi:class I SAM-dependent methyltransferase [Actinocorallia sp. API 0066]|uniref:class I SAM-dependent methyltransferase n=1 Tax=Actinocorallia sp. API 0066 TaxID=2896846 RepID=UPI001E52AB0B|nr:class I SAM-dependent methyltransferase [Actinocorallia sp. API 0066]MCD0453410.1 class I SAM-dependent methyltransferase [Actinocorallia sp. API 0066]